MGTRDFTTIKLSENHLCNCCCVISRRPFPKKQKTKKTLKQTAPCSTNITVNHNLHCTQSGLQFLRQLALIYDWHSIYITHGKLVLAWVDIYTNVVHCVLAQTHGNIFHWLSLLDLHGRGFKVNLLEAYETS